MCSALCKAWWIAFAAVITIGLAFQFYLNPRLVDTEGNRLDALDGRWQGYSFTDVQQLFSQLTEPAYQLYMLEFQVVDTIFPFALATLFWVTIYLAANHTIPIIRWTLKALPLISLLLDLYENHLIRGMLVAYKDDALTTEMVQYANTITILKCNAYTVNGLICIWLVIALCIYGFRKLFGRSKENQLTTAELNDETLSDAPTLPAE